MVKFSAKKPMTVFVAVIVVIVLGVIALRGMTPDLLPNMDFPYVIIVTSYPGAAPEAVEETVTRPIEQSMATLDDIETISSSSSESVSMVVLQFQNDSAMDGIMVDILSKLDSLKAGFDDMVGAPYILRINPSMLPVEVAAVEMEGMSIRELSQFAADTLIPELEGVTGVASISAYGIQEEQVEILINNDKVDAVNKKVASAVNDELAEAKAELDEAQADLDEARAEIEDGWAELEQSQNDTFQQLASAAQGVDNAVAQSAAYSAQLTSLNAEQMALQTEKDLSEDALVQLRAGIQTANDALTQLSGTRTAIAGLLALGLPAETPLSSLGLDAATLAMLQGMGCSTVGGLAAVDTALGEQVSTLQTQLGELTATEAQLTARIAQIDVALGNKGTEIAAVQAINDQLEGVLSAAIDNYQTVEVGQMTAAAGFGSADAQLAAAESAMEQAQQSLDDALEQYNESVDEALRQANISDTITLETIAGILAAQDFDMPAGYVYEEGLGCIVSVGDEIASVTELESLMLFDLGMEGLEPIYLKDVADITVTNNADSIYARLNGETGLILTFNKQSSYPTAGVCDNIREAYGELSEEYPGLEFVSMMDQGEYIYEVIESIFSSLLWGAVFSVIVLLLFLRDIRPTFVTLCSIPISLMFALVLMYFSGVTLNMMSMAGLSISVGMLVDNSVVVIENTYRLRRLGEPPIKAAVSGAGQVAGAVAASTITTICVFVPMAFSEGITKELFTDVALTMGYSLVASLIVSLTLVPAMASGMLKNIRAEDKGLLQKIMPGYRKILRWSLKHKLVVILLALVLLGTSAADILRRGFSFLPEMESTQISVTITMPEDTAFDEAVEIADEALARIGAIEGVDTVAGMMSDSGGGFSLMGGSGDGSSVTGYVTMQEDTKRRSDAVTAEIEEVCAGLPCTVTADNGSMMSSFSAVMGGSGITVNVYASDLDELQTAAMTVAETLAQVEGVDTVDNGIEDPSPELHFVVDKERAMAEGLTVAQVYQEVAKALTSEAESISIRFGGLDHTVIVKAAEQSDMTRDVAENIHFKVTDREGKEKTVFLRDIAELEETQTLSTINRDEQRRYLSVTARIAEGHSVTQVTAEAEAQMKNAALPEGTKYEFSGENETIMEAMEDLLLMLVVGILLVYLVMVAQFQSLKAPFIVMFTIPLAFTGGFIALSLCGMDLNILSMLGLIMLTGVIVNNGIVLVDYINQLRLEGMKRRDAIVESCVTRMRPVLMTTITTVLGMFVMALGRDESAMLMQPLAVTCIGGLVYGTLMTLFVVPVIYDMLSKKELRVVKDEDLVLSEK